MKRILLARIGWMKFYTGSQPGDKKPIGGGKWNKKHTGGEVNNFRVRSGRVYGAIQKAMSASSLNLRRIDPKADGTSLKRVLIIFFAKDPRPASSGQVVVGWYENATVFSNDRFTPWWHSAVATEKNIVLLPTHRRTCVVPRGRNAPGQANVYFPFNADGSYRKLKWVDDILRFVDSYSGPNLVSQPEAEADPEVQAAVEKELTTAFLQGTQPDPAARRAIENTAMNSARRYFKGKSYTVSNVSSSRSYDLHCSKNGRDLFVEVKGSQTPANKILLTPNEVAFARRNPSKMALYVLHSIKVTKRKRQFRTSGGQRRVMAPWRIHQYQLKPIQYLCNLSK